MEGGVNGRREFRPAAFLGDVKNPPAFAGGFIRDQVVLVVTASKTTLPLDQGVTAEAVGF